MQNYAIVLALFAILVIQFIYLCTQQVPTEKLPENKFVHSFVIFSIFGSHFYVASILGLVFLQCKNQAKFFEWTGILSFKNLIIFLFTFLITWTLLLIISLIFLWELLYPVGFYLFTDVISTVIVIIWLFLAKRKHDSTPSILGRIERTTNDHETTDLESQKTRKNRKLTDAERIRKLEANQFYLMQKWLIELELVDDNAARRIRKEIRARCSRTYFDLTLPERERLIELAREDSVHRSYTSRRGSIGSVQSNRVYGNPSALGFHPHGRKAHSHVNLLKCIEPSPLCMDGLNSSHLSVFEKINELPTP